MPVSRTITSNTPNALAYRIDLFVGDADCDNFWLNMKGVNVGASSKNGKIQGCYIHGLFSSDAFRHAYLTRIGADIVQSNYSDKVELTLNALAKHMELHCDLDELLKIASQSEPKII